MSQLGITYKVVSKEAFQALLPFNILKRQIFWSQPPPHGIVGVDRRRFTDTDECGIELESVNRTRGHSGAGIRIVKKAHYSKNTKLTIILTVEPGDPALAANVYGSRDWPRRWLTINVKAGTTTIDFNDHIEVVCQDLQQHWPAGQVGNDNRFFLWDNLSSHCAPLVHQTVEAMYNHMIIRRPPYRPRDAPIEYVFCQLVQGLQRRQFDVHNNAQLITNIQNVVMNLRGFYDLFGSLGY